MFSHGPCHVWGQGSSSVYEDPLTDTPRTARLLLTEVDVKIFSNHNFRSDSPESDSSLSAEELRPRPRQVGNTPRAGVATSD